MNRPRRNIPSGALRLAAAVLFAGLLGVGPLGLLQAAAWAGMLWNYTQQDGSLLSGVKKTFDGEHPCTMCTSIKEAKEKERSVPATVISPKKIELLPAPLCASAPLRLCREFVYPPSPPALDGLAADAPPVPVPIDGRA